MRRGIQELLIRRPFLGNLLHKLFSGDETFLNQELRECVGLVEVFRARYFVPGIRIDLLGKSGVSSERSLCPLRANPTNLSL
jgi:hypothetical protein